MAFDEFDRLQPRRRAGPGRIVVAGVLTAMLMGGGVGLWARPVAPGEAVAEDDEAAAPEDLRRPALQIIIDDAPAPIGPLLDVLPGDHRATSLATPHVPAAPPAPVAPRRPANGLMKVDTPAVAPVATPLVTKVEAKPRPEPEPIARKPYTPAKARKPEVKVAEKPKPAKPKTVVAAARKAPEKARAAKLAKAA